MRSPFSFSRSRMSGVGSVLPPPDPDPDPIAPPSITNPIGDVELIQGEGDFAIDLRTIFADATSYSANGGGSSIDVDGFTLRVPDGSLLSGVTVTATASNASVTSTNDTFDVTVSAAPVEPPAGDTTALVIELFDMLEQTTAGDVPINLNILGAEILPVTVSIVDTAVGAQLPSIPQIIAGQNIDGSPARFPLNYVWNEDGVTTQTLPEQMSAMRDFHAVAVDSADPPNVSEIVSFQSYNYIGTPPLSSLSVTQLGAILSSQTNTRTPSFDINISTLNEGQQLLLFYGANRVADSATVGGNFAEVIDRVPGSGANRLSAVTYILTEDDLGPTINFTPDLGVDAQGADLTTNTHVVAAYAITGGLVESSSQDEAANGTAATVVAQSSELSSMIVAMAFGNTGALITAGIPDEDLTTIDIISRGVSTGVVDDIVGDLTVSATSSSRVGLISVTVEGA